MTTFQVPQRMNFSAVSPKVFKAVLALDAVAREGLDPVLLRRRSSLSSSRSSSPPTRGTG